MPDRRPSAIRAVSAATRATLPTSSAFAQTRVLVTVGLQIIPAMRNVSRSSASVGALTSTLAGHGST